MLLTSFMFLLYLSSRAKVVIFYLIVKILLFNAFYIKIQGWPRSHSCYESRSSSLWLLKYDTKPLNSPEPSSSYCLLPASAFECACC